jgi:hypothetical protein
MTQAIRSRCVLASLLVVSVAVLPSAAPIAPQQLSTPPPEKTRVVDWHLLGLLGLLGLAGLSKRPGEYRPTSASGHNRP